jgi:hypothetical protein
MSGCTASCRPCVVRSMSTHVPTPLDPRIKHLHARRHSQSGAFAPFIKSDSDFVFEDAVTCHMCAHLGVGVKFSAPYAHHMLGKAECPWRTIQDNASATICSSQLHVVMRCHHYCVPPQLHVQSLGRPQWWHPLTLLTSFVPHASRFRVFGCAVFAKVPDNLRRKLSEKAFRGVMVGYPTDAPGYRVYNNPETRRIATSVHAVV